MQPILIVEGKQLDVAQVNYHAGRPTSVGIFDEHGNYKIYHDTKENLYIEAPLKIDLSECLKWQGRYDELYQTLDKVIEEKSIELRELAIENIESQLPFTPNEIQQQYFYMQREQMGLIDAQEIVHEFMVDDVDLTGGEE